MAGGKPAAHSVVLVIRVGDMPATLDRITGHGGIIAQPRGRIGM